MCAIFQKRKQKSGASGQKVKPSLFSSGINLDKLL